MASNPYVNKVQLADGRSLIDISDTTATADKILEGYTAYGANGQKLTGTASGSGSGVVWQDAQGYVHLSDEGDVPLQTKSATPSETAQSVTPDAGYYALSKVDVGAISPTYVGSEVARRTSSDLTASGATVTAPAGYYASSASKSVATTTHPNPTASVNSSTGVVTASHTQGTGYVTGGTTTGTLNLTTQAAKTVTPSTSSQTAVAAGRYTTGAVTVAAMPSGSVTSPTSISGTSATVSTGTNTLTLSKTVSVTPNVTTAGYISSGTAGNSSVSLTASVTTKSAATITPRTYSQTAIQSGQLAIGDVTVAPIPSEYVIPNGTYYIYDNGLYDVSTKSQVSVNVTPSYSKRYFAHFIEQTNNAYCTITNLSDNSSIDLLNRIINFDEGETLAIRASGHFAAKIYLDGVIVANSGQDSSVTYNWTATGHNINIQAIVPEGSSITNLYITTV